VKSPTLPTTAPPRSQGVHDPAYQAFMLLRTAFTVAPIVFGVDKATNLLTDWQHYLSPTVDHLVPGTSGTSPTTSNNSSNPHDRSTPMILPIPTSRSPASLKRSVVEC
jgi:hypothetical protein